MTPTIEPGLPELPEYGINTANHAHCRVLGFTADQMRAYALSAIAADRNKREGGRCPDGKACSTGCAKGCARIPTSDYDPHAPVSAGLSEIDKLQRYRVTINNCSEVKMGCDKNGAYVKFADVRALSSRLLPPDWVAVPMEPSRGLLVSMAIRTDHGLGVPGHYDAMNRMLGKTDGVTHAQRFENTIGRMRQLHEEVVGAGFYRPEREADYVAIAAAPSIEGNSQQDKPREEKGNAI
jgi:hypothetical protein